jgi:hypothetical protein
MDLTIPVANEDEREAIQCALMLPDIRAFVIMIGVLNRLPTNRARERVLNWIADHAEEADALANRAKDIETP